DFTCQPRLMGREHEAGAYISHVLSLIHTRTIVSPVGYGLGVRDRAARPWSGSDKPDRCSCLGMVEGAEAYILGSTIKFCTLKCVLLQDFMTSNEPSTNIFDDAVELDAVILDICSMIRLARIVSYDRVAPCYEQK